MTDTTDFLNEFFDEFQYRLSILTSNSNKEGVDKDLLFLLVENLILKYENRMQSQHGLLYKLVPFLRKSGYDTEFEESIDAELEKIALGKHYTQSYADNKRVNGKISSSFSDVLNANRVNYNLPTPIFENKLLDHLGSTFDLEKYSKTNIPASFDIGLHVQPLPGKGQDHLDFFVIDEDRVGVVLCDGVSGDGPDSAYMAQSIPKILATHIKTNFRSEMNVKEWKQLIEDGLRLVIEKYSREYGSSTVLVALIDKSAELLYIAWMGDGHLIYFNEQLTGFSKLLTSHQNATGQLTKVVTSKGLLGEPSVQIISSSGGAIILSSDGYSLSNGRVLRHLFQTVLRKGDINKSLHDWVNPCCEDLKLHPKATDDRSIGIIRWDVEGI